eukprot:bmy_15264T0
MRTLSPSWEQGAAVGSNSFETCTSRTQISRRKSGHCPTECEAGARGGRPASLGAAAPCVSRRFKTRGRTSRQPRAEGGCETGCTCSPLAQVTACHPRGGSW